MTTFHRLAMLGFAVAGLGGVVCAVIVVVNMFRAVSNRKPGVPLFPSWWESPFNILFRPTQLTEAGLAARRRCFYGLLGFLLCWVIGAIIGVTAGLAQ